MTMPTVPHASPNVASMLAALRGDASTLDLPILEPADVQAAPNETLPDETLDLSVLGLFELILKRPDTLNRVIRDPRCQPILLPRFLAISLAGFVFFGVALALIFSAAHAWPTLTPIAEWLRERKPLAGASGLIENNLAGASGLSEPVRLVRFESVATGTARWWDGSAIKLTAAYAFGLIATTGVCLPSLYFYGLLAGVRMTWLDVAVQALKSKATSAVALVGILPIYAALGMGIVIFDAPESLRLGAYWLGLILPFIAGLWGTAAIYRSFATLCDTLPPDRRYQRTCFLRRLVAAWAACYTAVAPVMIFTLWEHLAR